MTDPNRTREIEIVARVRYPHEDDWHVVAHVSKHANSASPYAGTDAQQQAEWLRDRREHAESYVRQAVAEAIEIKIESVEHVEDGALYSEAPKL